MTIRMRLAAFACCASILGPVPGVLANSPLPEQPEPVSSVGYASVADALADLKARPGADVREQAGWTVIVEAGGETLWSFTPSDHPAHPTVVKRMLIRQGDAFYVQSNALCEAEKAACDALMAQFEALDERIRQDLQDRARAN